jgi:hypothetical protein
MTSSSPDHRAKKLPWWGLAGVGLLALGGWILATDVPAWNTLWYLFAWYGWLLSLDAALEWLASGSWLRRRRGELLAMMAWSVPFWYVFEAYNLRLRNWYYVFALGDDRLQLLVSFAAFATVFPACLLHAELAAALWPAERLRWRPFAASPAALATVAALGVACAVLPLLWPRWAFGLVWGALLFLPELVSRAIGAPSLLRDLEAGRPQRLLHLLAGGLVAGLVWESLNYWARCKWIYTVPFFDGLKLFEMPLAGFLGFPPLALSAFATWSALAALLRADVTAGAPGRWRAPRGVALAAAIAALFGCVLVYERVLADTVAARRPLLRELTGLTAEDAMMLEASGLESPERLERAVAARGAAVVAAESGVSQPAVERASAHAALAVHKGMGTAAAALLRVAGVTDVAALGRSDAERLTPRLRRLAEATGLRPPRRAEVEVWVAAAHGRVRPRR